MKNKNEQPGRLVGLFLQGDATMDIQLHYVEKGCGEVLVLLHGNGEDSSYFEHQIEYFSSYFRVIAVDTRGHGKSERGTKPFTLKQFADDLYDFMVQYQNMDL